MYPADKLDATPGYVAADLPDAITVFEAGTPINLPRSGTTFGPTSGSVYKWRVSYYADYSGTGFPQWAVEQSLLTNPYDSFSAVSAWDCLITQGGDGNLTPGDDTVEDQFAPTYSYTSGFSSGTLTRVSLCVWEDLASGSEDPPMPKNYIAWVATRLDGTPGFVGRDYNAPVNVYEKTDPQNSPVGTYESVPFPGLTITVTE
jgi:hypothetical protein